MDKEKRESLGEAFRITYRTQKILGAYVDYDFRDDPKVFAALSADLLFASNLLMALQLSDKKA